MFKKIKNAMPRGGSGGGRDGGSGFRQKVQTLEQMGFSTVHAKNALEASNGNLEQATHFLLSSSQNDSAPASASRVRGAESEEDQLARAIQESLQTSNTKTTSQSRGPRSAAAIRAGQAAAARAENASSRFGANGKVLRKKGQGGGQVKQQTKTSANKAIGSIGSAAATSSSSRNGGSNSTSASTSVTTAFLAQHPNVKVPKQLKDHSRLEQILRSTQRLAPEVLAVDTLLNAFIHIRDDPNNDKYRKIDRSSQGYIRALRDKPGALDLLRAVNFHERTAAPTSDLIMNRSSVDHALLYMGISALEEVRRGEEYLNAKRYNAFLKEVQRIKDGSNVDVTRQGQEDEVIKRAAFISKCPAEPSGGAGALVQVKIGEETISRRFDGDDVLKDVIHWIGGHGSAIPNMIMTREWCLVDLHRYPVTEIDVEGDAEKTLQYIGCWPSGKLEIRPSTSEWKDHKVPSGEAGLSRGLGSMPN